MKKKNLFAILLCLCLLISLFSGCSTAKEQEPDEDTPVQDTPEKEPEKQEDENSDSPEDKQDEAEEEEPESYLPLVKDGESATITIGLRQNALVENYDTNDFTLYLEESTGIDLEFVYFSNDQTEAVTQLNLMISGGQELPDILWGINLDTTLINEYGADGYFLDLIPYFETYTHFWDAEYAKLSSSDQTNYFALGKDPVTGSMFAFPECQTGRTMSHPANLVYINQVWLDAIGEEIPSTPDELYTVLKKFAEEDPNGNGVADEIPLFGFTNGFRSNAIEYLMNAFVYINDEYIFNAENGQLWVPYVSDEYREALIYFNKLYAENLIAPQTFTIANSGSSEAAAIVTPSDKVAIAGIIGAHPLLHSDTKNEVFLEYTALPPLSDATGKGGFVTPLQHTFNYNTFITSDCEDPVLAFQLLDFMTNADTFRRMRFGLEGTHWKFAEEGQLDRYSEQADIEVLDSSLWGGQNNYVWHTLGSCFASYDENTEVLEDDGSFEFKRVSIQGGCGIISAASATPDEIVYKLAYTAEEAAVIAEVETILKDYLKEALALFITGVMDPSNEDDWQAYLDNCENQGLSRYLEVAQSAYTRMNG